MRSRQGFVVVLLAICGLAAMASVVWADTIVLDTTGDVLYGESVVASSNFGGEYTPAMAVDGKAGGAGADMVFGMGDGSQRLVIHDFNSPLQQIRVWTNLDTLQPTGIGIRSSTNNNSSLDDTFATQLIPMTALADGDWTLGVGGYYKDFFVDAPTGTQSLFFSVQGSPYSGGNGFTRLCEVMGYANAISPEPSTALLAACGLMSLLAYAWRKRR
jgi:hypothetical protein